MVNIIINFFKKHFFLTSLIFITLTVFCLYAKVLSFDWVYLDDDVLILDKQNYLSFSNIKNIFSDTVFAVEQDKFCRPLLNCTFLVEKYLYGISPKGYHLTNVLIHTAVAFFLFLLLCQFYDRRKNLILTILFVVHPALVQAVAWVPGRNDSILTLFIIISFLFFIKYLKNSKNIFLFLSLLLFVCSLLTKETAIMFPVLCLLFMLFQKSDIKNILKVFICFTVITVAYFVYRTEVLSFQTVSVDFKTFLLLFYNTIPVITKYIANIFCPFNLTVFLNSVNIQYLLSVCSVLIFVLMLLLLKVRYNSKISFGILWFVLFLLPTFIMPNNQFYDHRIYLPMVGILFVLSEIIKYAELKKIIAVSVCFFCLFCFFAYKHSLKFENKKIFWINAYMDSPNSPVTNGRVADLLTDSGSYDKAVEKYLKAIEIDNNSRYYVNLSVCYLRMGKIDDAEQILLKALTLKNNNPTIYYNLALIYKYKKKFELAKQMQEAYISVFNVTNKYKNPDDLKI